MMYNEIVHDCFFLPQHVGALSVAEPGTVSFRLDSQQGVVIALSLCCDINHKISAVCFKTNGNPYVIASLEWLCRQSIGKQLEQLSCNCDELIRILDVPFAQSPALLLVQRVYEEVLRLMNKKLEGDL